MISTPQDPSAKRRICLILEGTYPYVSGGVSTWVHQMIEAMPEIEFSIHYIGDQRKDDESYKYELPGNVVSITTSYLFDPLSPEQLKPGRGSRRQKAAFLQIIRSFVVSTDIRDRFDALCQAAVILRDQPGMFTYTDLTKSELSWELLTESYEAHAGTAPFLRYHATIRDLATTFWKLLHTAGSLPAAHAYHCVCTGYAGLLGSLASELHGVPFLLSEHGVYLKERIEDIRKSNWLAASAGLITPFRAELGTFKSLWIDFFNVLCQIAYNKAAGITALYQGNARVQIEFGAPADKVVIIPNGIDTTRFTEIARAKLQPNLPPNHRVTVGFLGRVVPIKDVKTLIRAARLVLQSHPETRFLLAGPTDEDPDYSEECLALCDQLGIAQSISISSILIFIFGIPAQHRGSFRRLSNGLAGLHGCWKS